MKVHFISIKSMPSKLSPYPNIIVHSLHKNLKITHEKNYCFACINGKHF
jgi:nitrate reductase cytochrome c-type subunit